MRLSGSPIPDPESEILARLAPRLGHIRPLHAARIMPRPSQPLRLLIALALLLGATMLLLTLLQATDSALAIWQRLETMPGWMRWSYLALLASLGLGAGWGTWRLLRPRGPRAPRAAPLDRNAIEQRIERLEPATTPARIARGELAELDRRRNEATLDIALFGDISSGKTSLLRALAPQADGTVGVVGGTTTAVQRQRGVLPDGAEIVVADVPGLGEADDREHAALARAEAARSHALVYVADGDLTRSQDNELRALAEFGRPLILALNKSDRYRDDERDALLAALRSRYAGLGAQVIAVSAGREEQVQREWPDGRRDTVVREAPAQIALLHRELQRIARVDLATLETGREAALLARVDADLAEGERVLQAERSVAAVNKYTRRAIVGALAAIAPGTDLVIQGALAAALTRELCAIHGLQARDVDIDDLLARAGGLVRTSTSITLAVVGNALKAVPGFGTLGGGLVHAVAYGLIFDSLGRALADTLANTRALDRDATLDAFRASLAQPARERLLAIAQIALDGMRGQHKDSDA